MAGHIQGEGSIVSGAQTKLEPLLLVHLVTYSKGHRETSFHPSVPSSICPSVWSSICPVMVCLLQRGRERVKFRCGATGKVKDVVKHHFIHLSRHPSIHPSGHPSVSSWSVYSDGAEKEWNTNATRRAK